MVVLGPAADCSSVDHSVALGIVHLHFSIDRRRWPEPASGAIVKRWLVAVRGVMKEHHWWHAVRSTHMFISEYFIHVYGSQTDPL